MICIVADNNSSTKFSREQMVRVLLWVLDFQILALWCPSLTVLLQGSSLRTMA